MPIRNEEHCTRPLMMMLWMWRFLNSHHRNRQGSSCGPTVVVRCSSSYCVHAAVHVTRRISRLTPKMQNTATAACVPGTQEPKYVHSIRVKYQYSTTGLDSNEVHNLERSLACRRSSSSTVRYYPTSFSESERNLITAAAISTVNIQ